MQSSYAESPCGAHRQRSVSFRSHGLLEGLLCAISWAPGLRAGVSGRTWWRRGLDTHGSPHAAAALSTRATQDQQPGKDPESGVRAGGVRGVLSPPGSPGGQGCKSQTLPSPACPSYSVSGARAASSRHLPPNGGGGVNCSPSPESGACLRRVQRLLSKPE